MKRLIIKIEIEVGDIDRAKAIKEALEDLAGELPEDVGFSVRYDEVSE